jgi:hypothetical protein
MPIEMGWNLPGCSFGSSKETAVVDACLQIANEYVSKYHYPCLVGNLVTIPKSGEEETKNVPCPGSRLSMPVPQ